MQSSFGALLLLLLASLSVLAGRPDWIELETDSFRALSQVKERKSREILSKLQVFQAALGSMINVPAAPPKVPTQIFLLDQEAFRRAARGLGDVAGVFVGQPFRNDILIDASRPTTLSLVAIYHEYVHFQFRNHGHATLPAFYEEGLAQLVQYFQIRGRKYHYGFFPLTFAGKARSQMMPLNRLLAVDMGSDEYRSHQFQAPFYARSLLLLHYCTIGNRTCHAPLTRFATRLSNGDAWQNAFQEEFGTTPEAFDRELDAYLARQPDQYAAIRVESVPKPGAPRLKAISAEDANVEFGALLVRISRDSDGVDAWVAPTLASRPDHPLALATLALWHERSGRTTDADNLIARLAAAPAVDGAGLTRAGFVLLERAQVQAASSGEGGGGRSAGSEPLRRARELFKLALEREPTQLEAAYGYGITQILAPDDIQESLRIVEEAVRRFPESGELRMVQAFHLAMTGNERGARDLIALAACRVIDPNLRAFARKELGGLVCTKAN